MARLLLILFIGFVALFPAWAENVTSEESQKIDAARAVIASVEKDKVEKAADFAALLTLREKLDPLIEEVREVADDIQGRLSAAQAQLKEFGPAPAPGAPPESTQQAEERNTAQTLVAEIETGLRGARALLVRAEQLRDELTNARRELFNSRVLQHHDSIFSPQFWAGVANSSWPQFVRRLQFKADTTYRAISVRGGWTSLAGIAGFIALLVGFQIWLRRQLAWQRWHRADTSPSNGSADLTKGELIAHAIFVIILHSVPYVAIGLAISFTVAYIDVANDETERFMLGFAGALAAYGLSNATVRAVFAPHSARYRLVRVKDSTATSIVRAMAILLAVYLVGLIGLGILEAVSANVSMTIATTGISSGLIALIGGLFLLRRPDDVDDQASGLVAAPLYLLRPIFWLMLVAIVGSLILGYVALAGFIVGRAIATTVLLSFAIIAYISIEAIFLDALVPGKPANRRLSANFTLKPATIDLMGTILAGFLRVLTVVFTSLILLSPWGIEFGNLNPFADVFFGVRFSDLRGWIGAAGIAVLMFSVGLVVTRLFVSWLNNQLLPRTNLDTGVRHSVSTVAGYVGFMGALALALSQAGLQLQNVALVAGALSVGVGFGLQQVVSNFVAGLIVLAERPIRVGDVISVRGEEGRVQRISVRATELLLGENSTVIVPNSDIVSSVLKNRSFNDPTHRVTVKLVVTHDSDLRVAMDILLSTATGNAHVQTSPAPVAYIMGVTEAGIAIDMHVTCDNIKFMSLVRSDLYLNTLKNFREVGVRVAGSSAGEPTKST